MSDFLLIVLIVLAVVTVVGHLIWVAIAAICRAIVGGGERLPEERIFCRHCHAPNPKKAVRCRECNRELASPLVKELTDLDAFERQLQRFRAQGLIDAATAARLADCVRTRSRQLTEPAAQPKPQPAPVAAKPAPAAHGETPIVAQLADAVKPPLPASPAPASPPAAAPVAATPREATAVVPPAKPVPAPHPVAVPAAGAIASAPKTAPAPVALVKPAAPVVAKPVAPPEPRLSWAEILESFMEERNIRWGELIGGLLMVSSAICLVITLRKTLEAHVWLQFSVSAAVVSALFGVGLYAFHRWKLENTSRALLTISTLLVPLYYFATTRLSKGEWTFPLLAMEAASLGLFCWFTWLAARIVTPAGTWFQVAGVIGNAVVVLMVTWLTGHEPAAWRFFVPGLASVAVFAGAAVGMSRRASYKTQLTESGANQLFTVLGTAAFSATVALGLLVSQDLQVRALGDCLNRLSVILALAATALLSCGLRVVRGASHDDALAYHRTAGTLTTILGGAAILAALGLAWPLPLALLTVSLLGFLVLAWVAFRYGFPVIHAGAIACLTVAFLLVLHVASGNLHWLEPADSGERLLTLVLGVRSGVWLVGLAAMLGAAAAGLVRFNMRGHSEFYAGGCGVVALISLLIVSAHGLNEGGTDAALAMGVWALDAAALLSLNLLWRRPVASYLGLGLFLGATLWALRWRVPQIDQLWATVLALESLALVALGAVLPRRLCSTSETAASLTAPASRLAEAYRLPLLQGAEFIGALAFAVAAWNALPVSRSVLPLITAGSLVAVCLTLAWTYRSAGRTYLASGVLLVGLIHTLAFNYEGLAAQPWVAALLGHATATVLTSLGVWAWTQFRPASSPVDDLRRIFVEPLANASMVTSTLVIPVLLTMPRPDVLWVAVYLFWLAAIWLTAALTNRSPGWLSAAQVVLTLAAAAAATAWLERHPWTPGTAVDLNDPRTWQVVGISVALLTLLWSVLRIVFRGKPAAERLLNPSWPAVDRVVAHALIAGQAALAAWYTWAGCEGQLWALAPSATVVGNWPDAFGPHAWCLAGLAVLMALLALWHDWRRTELFTSLLAVATLSYLAAGALGVSLGTAATARWSMAVWFAIGVAVISCRQGLLRVCDRLGTRIDLGPDAAALSRGLLIATSAAPVLALTVLAACLRLGGVASLAPTAGTFFAQIGPVASYLVPLALVTAAMVGLALRERSAGYAFSAGLIVQLGTVLAYALYVVLQKRPLQTADLVVEIQLATIAGAVWAIAWLIARRWVNVWQEKGSGAVLMRLQLGMAAMANVLLLVVGIGLLALGAPHYSTVFQWTIATGTWLGWLALVLPAGAAAYRQFELRRAAQPSTAGLFGMAVLGLLACTVCTLWPTAPEWGYRTLMLGWALYGLFVVLATWWVASLRTRPGDMGPPQSLVRAAAGWVTAASLLAVLLGLKAAFLHHVSEDLLWGAAAIAIASTAGAAMAIWRRQEGWAFPAATGVNVAASLVVWFCQWHWRPNTPLADWWLLLVQANVIASAVVALVWLAARKRLYELRDLTVRASPLLALQTVLPVLGDVAILVWAVVSLVGSPQASPAALADMPSPAGWLALLLAAAAAAWYLRQVSPQDLFHVAAGLALGVGVLAACASPQWIANLPWKLDAAWIRYHGLTVAWAAMGLVMLGLGWLGRRWSLAGHAMSGPDAAPQPRQLVCPAPLVQQWVTLIGTLTVALSLCWCYADVERPWWSVGAMAAVSLAAGLLALWLRLPLYIYISGLLVNAAGSVAWLAWDEGNLVTLVETNALCFAATSAFWSLLAWALPGRVPAQEIAERRVSFAHQAAQAALALAGGLAAVLVAFCLAGQPLVAIGTLGWVALAAVPAALLIQVWDRSAHFVMLELYLAGLIAAAISLVVRQLEPLGCVWMAGVVLADFVLAAAVLGRVLPRLHGLWRLLGIPERGQRSLDPISTIQLLLTAIAAAIGVWVSMDFAFDHLYFSVSSQFLGRVVGPATAVVLLLASLLMAGPLGGRLREPWRYAVLTLGLFVLAEAGWAWFSPDLPLLTLHRSVILMVAAMVMSGIAAIGLPRLVSPESAWIGTGKRMAGATAALAGALVVAILGQEVYFHQPHGTPMAWPAVAVMALVLAGAIAALVTFAVWPKFDPMHWSDRRRQAYVYAAEVVLLLICVHLKLTVPKLFEFGIVEKYWMLLVMLAAFCGIGLSELFQRRGLPVLSEPLERTAALLPLAPAIGFWIPTNVPPDIPLAGPKPIVWFLAAVFYAVRAATRRSDLSTVLSVITVSVGFCSLWQQHQISFFERPQLWVIPIALAALIAEYLNHDRLTSEQSGGLRYLAGGLIYVSTTCDLFFIHQFEDWLVPLTLLVLSVLGALAGIALRIRSFLAMGVMFLTVSLLSMIYHTAFELHQKWVLAVCGLVLSVVIIALFAVFEKRRNDVLAAVEQLKHWQR